MRSDLRRLRDQLRKEHILVAARQVFAERGYQRATIRDIAEVAGVADGTIYNSFANKADLLLKLIERLAASIPLVSRAAPPSAVPYALADMLRARWAAFTPELIELLRVVLAESLVDADLRSLFLDRVLMPAVVPMELALAVNGGEAIDHAIASRAIVASVIGFAVLRMLGDLRTTEAWAIIPDHLARLLSDGLQRPEAAA